MNKSVLIVLTVGANFISPHVKSMKSEDPGIVRGSGIPNVNNVDDLININLGNNRIINNGVNQNASFISNLKGSGMQVSNPDALYPAVERKYLNRDNNANYNNQNNNSNNYKNNSYSGSEGYAVGNTVLINVNGTNTIMDKNGKVVFQWDVNGNEMYIDTNGNKTVTTVSGKTVTDKNGEVIYSFDVNGNEMSINENGNKTFTDIFGNQTITDKNDKLLYRFEANKYEKFSDKNCNSGSFNSNGNIVV